MTKWGLNSSRRGFSVDTASDKQLSFSSEWPLLPIEAEGEQTATCGAAPENITLYTHNLGYAPVFLIDRLSGTPFYPLQAFCDETKIWVSTYPGDDFVLRWKVFRRAIKTTYSAPNINVQDATVGLDDDYGVFVSLPGKSTDSTDKRDFAIRSDVRQLMIAQSGYTAENTSGVTVTHNLGYEPMYLAYVQGYNDDFSAFQENRFRLASEADDLYLTADDTTFEMVFYGLPWPQIAYILFKDTLIANG